MADKVDLFRNFLDTHVMLKSPVPRLVFSINAIREYNKELCNEIINAPLTMIPLLVDEVSKLGCPTVGFKGSLGEVHTPRSLSATHLSKLICLEGIVVSCSTFKPKMIRSVHYSEATNMFFEKEYRDSTMISRLPNTGTVYPTRDSNGPLQTEFGLSTFQDYETVTVQELVEKAPPGQLPRSTEVVLTDDLVGSVKPGDRMKFYGVYKAIGSIGQGFPSRFKTVLVVNNIDQVKSTLETEQVLPVLIEEKMRLSKKKSMLEPGEDKEDVNITTEIVKIIRASRDVIKAVSDSIAPSIFGHSQLKKAIALMLVGGNEVVRKNNARIRGDINILMVGDPSTAKSQFLRYIHSMSDLAILTTGKGSTGVGLTAAVVVNKDGDKKLEAGAMVLGDRGVVCIDEFDKMDEDDRVAIHEVMEQQTVTVAKAGIHTTLNSRCSVVAAANPVLGQYKESMSPSQNIGLMESLLTRFDLIFVMLDNLTEKEDEMVARHVVENHAESEMDDGVFKDDGAINQECLRMYLREAKLLRPVLSEEAGQVLSQAFVGLRQERNAVIAVTPRVLETLIRLSTAHAKLRMSSVVEASDARSAMELLRATLHVKPEEKAKKAKIAEKPCGDPSEYVSEMLFGFRERNPGSSCVSFESLLVEFDMARISEGEVREALQQLHAADVILFYDDNVFFLS